jgi:hypothetical protein
MTFKPPIVAFTLGAVLILVLGPGGAPAPATEVQEQVKDCQPVFGAEVCTWSRMAGSKVVAFGATVPMASIENSPDEFPMSWPPAALAEIPMPADARSATGVDHLTVLWEAHGHPPAPFLTPHFDFHFYVIDGDARKAITCADSTKPATLPAGYSLPDMELPELGRLVGICAPQMGMHSLPTTMLQDTVVFSGTMVMGFYEGRPIFYEPMIARAKLLERRSFSLPMVTPAGLGAGVHYPTKFDAEYDPAMPGYRFVFSGLPGGN